MTDYLVPIPRQIPMKPMTNAGSLWPSGVGQFLFVRSLVIGTWEFLS